MQYRVVEDLQTSDSDKSPVSDESVELTLWNTAKKYPRPFRRVKAVVEINKQKREMTFITNDFDRSARTICDLYMEKSEVEPLFKELEQTLQLQSFYGTNANAVKWRIWAALIVHLILRYFAFPSKWHGGYSRFAGIIRTAIWVKTDLEMLLKFYCIAGPPFELDKSQEAPSLPGFEKQYLKAIG